jgi:hypothetical protein
VTPSHSAANGLIVLDRCGTLIPDIAQFKSLRTSLEGFTLNANN